MALHPRAPLPRARERGLALSRSLEARAEQLFLELCELGHEEREPLLAERCAGDLALAARVRELLAGDLAAPTGFLDGAPPAPGAYLEPGSTFARFRVLRRIGEGGMGTVYAALQSMPRREVALKVIRPGRMSREALRRFRHEVEVLGNLHHPGIAQIYEAGSARRREGEPEQPWLAMELVRGQPLLVWARANELDDRRRLELLARVCDAVQHAHQRAVIHRDLKPENVLVTTEESTSASSRPGLVGRPVILDFGIARAVGGGGARRQRETRAGELLGTLASMSPEQLAGGSEAIDVRSDVYALGVMLYQLLAGRPPHDLEGKDVASALRELREEEPRPLDALDPRFRGDVATIVAKALAKDVERRYSSALELASDIRRFLAGEPIRARSDSALYVMRRQLRRHRVGFAVVALVLLLVSAFAVVVALQSAENRRLARAETAASARAKRDFEHALEAVDTLVEVAGRGLIDVPQAEEARRAIFLAARDFHRRVLAGREADAGSALGLARTRLALARNRTYLGEHEACLREAEELRAELEALPPSAERDELLAEAWGSIAMSCEELGRLDDALAALEAVAGLRGLPAAEEDWWLWNRLAARYHETGRLGEAETLLRELVARLEEVVRHDGSPRLRLGHALNVGALGILLRTTGRSPEAEPLLARSVALARGLLDEDPDSTTYASQLYVELTNHGLVLTDLGRTEEALAVQREAALLGERSVRDFPGVPNHRAMLIDIYINLSAAQVDDPEQAERTLARARELSDALVADFPDVPRHRVNRLGIELNRTAILLVARGRYEQAAEVLPGVLEQALGLRAELAGDARLEHVIAIAAYDLARCRMELADHVGAMEALGSIARVGDRQGLTTVLVTTEGCLQRALEEASDDHEGAVRRVDAYAECAAALLERSLAAGLRIPAETWESYELVRSHPRFDALMAASGRR